MSVTVGDVSVEFEVPETPQHVDDSHSLQFYTTYGITIATIWLSRV